MALAASSLLAFTSGNHSCGLTIPYTPNNTHSDSLVSQCNSRDREQEIEVGKEIGENRGECQWGDKSRGGGFKMSSSVQE